MTTPKLVHIDSFAVSGLHVRTINRDEFNPTTAKLPHLWGQFFSSKLSASPTCYGIYGDYESDLNGHYTVIAGVKTTSEIKSEGLRTVHIPTGDYLVFEGIGPVPQVVIEAWQRAWQFFETSTEYQRTYQTDFEEYRGGDDFALYIGIKQK